jgi:hypothetical protein
MKKSMLLFVLLFSLFAYSQEHEKSSDSLSQTLIIELYAEGRHANVFLPDNTLKAYKTERGEHHLLLLRRLLDIWINEGFEICSIGSFGTGAQNLVVVMVKKTKQ